MGREVEDDLSIVDGAAQVTRSWLHVPCPDIITSIATSGTALSAPPQVVGQPTADRTHVQVVVPAGVGPGIAFMVNTPSGQMQVTCPQGVSAGMPMMVNVAQSV